MRIAVADSVDRTHSGRGTRGSALVAFIFLGTLGSADPRAFAAETEEKSAPCGDLVYDGCLEAYAKNFGEQMLPIVCKVIGDDCAKNPTGDDCKHQLRTLDEGMKAAGSSMLFGAAHAGRADIVKTMLAMGSDANAAVSTGWTPLLIAAAEGHEEAVAVLLERGADPNVKNPLGRTALMFASSYGFTKIVIDLLGRGADPNLVSTDDHGWTALMVAARGGRIDTVKALLKSGARAGLTDKNGKTALALAEAAGHSDVARTLKEHSEHP